MLPTISCTSSSSPQKVACGPWLISPVSEEDLLIQRAQSGDLEAFNQLVLRYQDSVFRQAFWTLNEAEAAEDAAQETFLKAFCQLHTFHGGAFRPWLLRIATNHCLDEIRATRRKPSQPLYLYNEDGEETVPWWMRDPGETPEQALERAELEETLLGTIKKLPYEYRMALILVDLQDLDYAEAAAILRIPLGTFKSRLSRARMLARGELWRRKDGIKPAPFTKRELPLGK